MLTQTILPIITIILLIAALYEWIAFLIYPEKFAPLTQHDDAVVCYTSPVMATLALLVLSAACIACLVDAMWRQTPGNQSQTFTIWGSAFVAIFNVSCLWAFRRFFLAIDGDELIYLSPIRTRRFPLAEIVKYHRIGNTLQVHFTNRRPFTTQGDWLRNGKLFYLYLDRTVAENRRAELIAQKRRLEQVAVKKHKNTLKR